MSLTRTILALSVVLLLAAPASAQITIQHSPSAAAIARAAYQAGRANALRQQRAVQVDGYFRANGTYVQPHYRGYPDGNFYNNWSTYPNVNPYTGRMGTMYYPPQYYYIQPYGAYYGW